MYSSITKNTISIPKESISNEDSNIFTFRSNSSNQRFLGTKSIKYTTLTALIGVSAGLNQAAAILAYLGIPIGCRNYSYSKSFTRTRSCYNRSACTKIS